VAVYQGWVQTLKQHGAQLRNYKPDFWDDSRDIFLPIQAHEAAALHRGNFEHFERTIAERLAQGASLTPSEVNSLRARHSAFRGRMDALLEQHDFLMLPCAPMSALAAGADHSATRAKILRYTSPSSLAGTPTVALPGHGGGVQLIAARGRDSMLLAYAASLAG
jgi:aspartyl-tRNA(Asn)/glutamyl-tRNA(Gln) amidotransferase subunit A